MQQVRFPENLFSRNNTGDRAESYRGNTSKASQPGPSAGFCRVRVPPWASAIWRLSTNPIPEPAGFGGEKRHEQIRGIGKPGAFIAHPNDEVRVLEVPAHAYPAAGFERGVGCIAHEVDQQLLDLIRIGLDGDFGSGQSTGARRVSSPATRRTRSPIPTGASVGGGSLARRA